MKFTKLKIIHKHEIHKNNNEIHKNRTLGKKLGQIPDFVMTGTIGIYKGILDL